MRDSYSTIALWPTKLVKRKRRIKRTDLHLMSLQLTDTDAYFNYLEHQSEQCHKETVAQRTEDYDRVPSEARSSMTPEKIKQLRLERREEQWAIRAEKQEKLDEERKKERRGPA